MLSIGQDPLCALDNTVEERIWQSLFGASGLLRGKTVIMASNSVKRFSDADHLIYLENATVLAQGLQSTLLQIPYVSSKLGSESPENWKHGSRVASPKSTTALQTGQAEEEVEADYEDDVDEEARATASGVVKAVLFYLSCAGWTKVLFIVLSCTLGMSFSLGVYSGSTLQ